MSRLPVPGSDDNTWGTVLNDFLSQAHNADGSLKNGAITAAGGASDSTVVHNTGNETIAGVKTFSSSPTVPTPSLGTDAANKTYVDTTVGAGAPDATASTKGILRLTGDLGGTALNPTVPGLANKENTANKGVANGYASLDGTTKIPIAQIPTGTSGTTVALGNHTHTLTFSLGTFSKGGTLSVATGTQRFPVDGTYTTVGTRATVGTASVGADIILDIKKNGTTIYTTSANRPTITAGTNSTGPGATPDITTLVAGDYLTVDIVQVGSTTPGSDLTVTVIVNKTVA